MKMKRTEKINPMNRLAKIVLVMVLTMTISAIMPGGWYQSSEAEAAVGFAASSESHTGTTGSTNQASFTWSHAGGATPRGVLVYVYTFSATDTVTSVTYGGTAMTRVAGGAAIDTATEPGRTDTFFLGASVPTGTQNVVVNRTNNATVMYATAITVTAAYDTEPTGIVLLQENGTFAEQSVNDGSPGSNSMRFAGAYSGANLANLTQGASSTLLQSIGLATNTYNFTTVRETTAGQGARNVGFTYATSDDRAAVHLAVREIIPTLTIGDGTTPANANAPRSALNNALNGFTMGMNAGAGTVNSLTVTGSANFTATNIPTNGVKVWRDAGTIGVWDGADVLISTASTAIATNATTVTISNEPITTTVQNYLVTVDITAGATLNQTFTGTISAAAGTGLGTPVDSDATSATLTVSAVQNLTVGNGTNPANNPTALTGSRDNALDAFTLALSAGTGNVGQITVTGSANFTAANISGINIYRDNATVGTFNVADVLVPSTYSFAGNVATVNLISAVTVTTATANYLVLVDFSPSGTDGSFTGTVTAVAGSGLSAVTYNDASSATLTTKHPSTIATCSGCHGDASLFTDATSSSSRGNPDGAFVGDHNTHVVKLGTACSTCHVAPAASDYAHRNGTIQMQTVISGGSYTRGTSFAQTNTLSTTGCSNISCHGANNPTPQWGVGTAGCVDCHNGVINAPQASVVSGGTVTNRQNVVNEFSLTWSHKRSAGRSVSNYDCIVCHVEGDMSTGKPVASKHMNGYIDLRDPDTGAQIMQVQMTGDGGTWNQTTVHTAAGSYVSTAVTASFVRFSRNLGVRLEADTNWQNVTAIQMNQCLKCHDANGAASTSAQVPGGSAMQPFGVAITGHVAPFNSNGSGNVVDVASSFSASNAAYHPVSGRQNNSYAQGALMVAPWNMTKTTGNNTSYGYLMSCWDCHAPAGASGTLNRTVTAHGAAATLRAPVFAAGTTAATLLCLNCHVTSYASTAGNHATGSAFTGGNTNMSTATFNNCAYCHSYTAAAGATAAPTLTSRPLRAENVHGFNDRDPNTAGSKWVNGTASHRPYAFIRNTLSYWSPTSVSTAGETLQRSRGCTGTGGTCNTNMSTTTVYTTGGVY